MLDETLFILLLFIVWVVTFILMWYQDNPIIAGASGIVGILLGIELIASAPSAVFDLAGGVIIVIALYQLYVAAFERGK